MRWRKVREGFRRREKKGEVGKWEGEGRKKIGKSEKIGRREGQCDTGKSDIIHTLSDSQ